jgi:hypothetical protein
MMTALISFCLLYWVLQQFAPPQIMRIVMVVCVVVIVIALIYLILLPLVHVAPVR